MQPLPQLFALASFALGDQLTVDGGEQLAFSLSELGVGLQRLQDLVDTRGENVVRQPAPSSMKGGGAVRASSAILFNDLEWSRISVLTELSDQLLRMG